MEYKVKAEIEISLNEQDIEDMVVCMIEGGIGYWACLDNTGDEFENAPKEEPVSITAANILKNGGTLVFYDQEDDDRPLEMNLQDLLTGVQKWIEFGYPPEYCLEMSTKYIDGKLVSGCQIDMCNFDGTAADNVAQLAMLGDIVYA